MATLLENIPDEIKGKLESKTTIKHPGSISIINYKGGVGKTTLSCLLGYYLAKLGHKVLLIDIDPQCSLSLAVGFDPDTVSKTDFTIYNLMKPNKWCIGPPTKYLEYIEKVKDEHGYDDLHILKGSFKTDELDFTIIQSMIAGERKVHELYLYTKQLLNRFTEYDYIIIDCPPNRMYLTQAMLRASKFYITITIPDAISVFGMPRLDEWVKQIKDDDERPYYLGYVLNEITRIDTKLGGMVYSQQEQRKQLNEIMNKKIKPFEKSILKSAPLIGQIPRLDIISKFLAEKGDKTSRWDFDKKTSNQPTLNECMTNITKRIVTRIDQYNKLK
jgi:cellulose biosynthesis protein BcsQ